LRDWKYSMIFNVIKLLAVSAPGEARRARYCS